MKDKIFKSFFYFIIGIVLLLLIYFYGGVNDFQWENINYIYLIHAFLATIAITTVLAMRWGIMVNAISGKKISFIKYYYYFIISRAVGNFLPKDIVDVGFRSFYLKKRHNIDLTSGGTSVFLDRFFDLFIAVITFFSVLPFWFNWVDFRFSIIFLLIIFFLMGVFLYFYKNIILKIASFVLNIMIKIIHKPFSSHPKKKVLQDFIDNNTILKIYILSIFKFFFTVSRFVAFSFVLGFTISPIVILLVTPIGQLSYVFAFTPGGLGIFEAGWFGGLIAAGINEGDASLFVIGQRVFTVLLVSILALLYFLFFKIFYEKRNVNNF